MSFQLPTLQDLLDRTRKSFRTNLPGSDAWIWPNNIGPSAKVIAGAVFEVFGFASYIAKMIFASTAPDLETLILHGNEFGISLRPAAPAVGKVILTSDGDDLMVSVNAVFRRSDGVEFLASTSGSRSGAGTLIVPVIALANGANTNTLDGTALEVVSGVTGDALAEASGDVVGGADIEDKETFRARILFRKRYPPHGGAASDYVMWAMSVPGVTRVFVERLWSGVGTVRVFVLMDDLFPNGIPGPADVERVADYIETVRPAGAIVTVQAPAPHIVDVMISGLTPDTTTLREAVLAELREAFPRLGRVAGNDTVHGGMPFLATPFVFPRAWIWQAVGNAGGLVSDAITLPSIDTALIAGEIPVLGTVSFV